MAKSKKIISIVLAFALLLTSVFVGGITASANLDSLYSTSNDYDSLPDGIGFSDVSYAGYPATNLLINGSPEMESANEGDIRFFSAWSAQVQQLPEAMGSGRALHMTAAGSGDKTDKYQTIARIYKSDSETLSHFRPTANTTYEVKLRYYAAETPNKEIQLQVRHGYYSQCSYQPNNADDGVWMEPPVIASITEATNGWVEAVAYFTAPATTYYLNVCLSSATSGGASNVDVWVDDVTVSECVKMNVRNYTPENDKAVPVSKLTTVGDLCSVEAEGYRFGGAFADEQMTDRISADDLAGNYTEIYFNWLPITLDNGYCGFEDYSQPVKDTAYNSLVSELSTQEAYVGRYSMKTSLAANGIAAFEIKNANSFVIEAGKTYTVDLSYKTDADAKIYVGIAKLGDVPYTAKALSGIDAKASDNWQTATLSLTPDKSTNENYVLSVIVYAENGATVYVDDILVSGFKQSLVNPTLNTGFSSEWYPNLATLEGIELPEPPQVWDGTVATEFAGGTGTETDPYLIENGAQLAYAVQNGSFYTEKSGAKYFLITKDIYLNDINCINWQTGAALNSGYTPKNWFRSASWSWNAPGLLCSSNFCGNIDGNGHTVYGLYYNTPSEDYSGAAAYATGLIPVIIGDSSIKNLKISDAYINTCYNAGVFVGSQSGADLSIDRCYATASVYVNGYNAGVFSGLVNTDTKINLTNSASEATASVRTTSTAYGLTASQYNSYTYISNCFNANGPLSNYESENYNTVYKIYNSYQTADSGKGGSQCVYGVTTVSADNMKGLDVFTNEAKMPLLNLGYSFVATEGYPVIAVLEGIEIPEIWDGTVSEALEGEGTEEAPYLIKNGEDLAYAITSGGNGAYYKLTKDVYLNDVDAVNWTTGEVTLGGYTVQSWYYNQAFAGTLDGDGHSVYGLYYNNTDSKFWSVAGVGLIPRVLHGESATVKNLAVDNAYISYTSGVSAFVGCGGTNNSYAEVRAQISIDRCVAGQNVTLSGNDTGAFRGITRGADTTITNSYSLATTIGSSYGLVAGEAWESNVVITNCFNANGPFGSASGGTFTNSYQTVAGVNGSNVIDASQMQGTDVFTDAGKMPDLNADGAFASTDTYPSLTVFNKESSSDTPTEDDKEETEEEIVIWGGKEDVSAPLDNDGDGVYEIYTPAEFAYVIANYGTMNEVAGCSFVLKNDIYLNDITRLNVVEGNGNELNSWYRYEANDSVGFTGTIDGDDHTVYGLYFNNTNSFGNYSQYGVGLVPAAKGEVTVKNLFVDYSWIRYEGYASVFCGIGRSGATLNIVNCGAGNNIHHYAYGVGAFRGNSVGMTTNITNSYSLANLHANGGAYGMVSTINGAVNVAYSYIVGAPVSSTASALTSVVNSYESVKSGADNGAILVDAANMMGEDVLTNSDKMPLLAFASAYVPGKLDFADYDYYIYLPMGTVISEDYGPMFLDTYFTNLEASYVMDGDTLKRGAYIKFEKEPDASKITVPANLASFIRQGTYEEVSNAEIHNDYYGIETKIVSKKLSEQSADALNYIFITDIHFMNYDLSWDKQGVVLLEQVRHITEMANNDDAIDFIVVGGDSVQGFWDTKDGWKNAITKIFEPFKECNKPVFITMGNHDDNAYATWNVDFGAKVISDLDWKNTVLDPISPADIVRPEGDPNAKNYYYDFEKNGKITRLFFLDSIDYYQEYDENGTITALEIRKALGYTEESAEDYSKYYNGRSYLGYSGEQVKWLADSLAKTDEFDNVMVFSHMGTDAATSPTEFGAEVADVMAAYNGKTAYKNEELGIDVSYSDSGKILGYQFGHIHREVSVYNALAGLWQIGSSNARADQAQKTDVRVLGTASEACFDMMSVTDSGIRKFNIGGGTDSSYVSKANTAYGDVDLSTMTDICDMVALAKTQAGESTAADVNRDNLIVYAADAEALRKHILGIE